MENFSDVLIINNDNNINNIYIICTIFVIGLVCFLMNKSNSLSNIPNIIHFVFGLKEQTEEFLFVYFVSIYSAWIINKPDKIYFYYHYEPYGKWYNKLKNIPNIIFEKVNIPTHIGKKLIKKTAHKADIIRMEKLITRGGIYMDIDTISVRKYNYLLNNEVVLGKEGNYGICNAIMMTKPNSKFFKIWMDKYEDEFLTDGWAEASIILPKKLYNKYSELVSLQDEDIFFLPSYNDTDKIFQKNNDIPNNLITLHLWESYSIKYIKNINDWTWAFKNSNTMYGKILLNLMNNYKINNNN